MRKSPVSAAFSWAPFFHIALPATPWKKTAGTNQKSFRLVQISVIFWVPAVKFLGCIQPMQLIRRSHRKLTCSPVDTWEALEVPHHACSTTSTEKCWRSNPLNNWQVSWRVAWIVYCLIECPGKEEIYIYILHDWKVPECRKIIHMIWYDQPCALR